MPVTIQEVSVESIPEAPAAATEPSNGAAGRSQDEARAFLRQWARCEALRREQEERVHAH